MCPGYAKHILSVSSFAERSLWSPHNGLYNYDILLPNTLYTWFLRCNNIMPAII
jgi:hypothetical protein